MADTFDPPEKTAITTAPASSRRDEAITTEPVPTATAQSSFFLVRWWRSFVLAPLRQADEEARRYPGSGGRVVAILVIVAVMLTLQHYFLLSDELYDTLDLMKRLGLVSLANWGRERLLSKWDRHDWLVYWALGNVVLYLVIPGLIIRLVFRERLVDYGLKLHGAFKDGWLYLVFFAIVGPLVLLVSFDAHFQRTYPFYRMPLDEPLWPWFWIWELLYACQFISLEFFFRGFMVHGLKHRLGSMAIPVMMVPYCMIHYGKPMPETFAAIIAGLALGFMSLRTRSIILGAAIHVTVALSMDFASLWQRGYFE
jgi:membrane protease YdiL (CAAX protease family)